MEAGQSHILTNADHEAEDCESCEDILDQVGLAGTNECSGLPVMLVVVA